MGAYVEINGLKHRIVSLRYENENGLEENAWDSEKYGYMADSICLSDAIKLPSNKESHVEELEMVINQSTEYLAHLKFQIADALINNVKDKALFPQNDVLISNLTQECIEQEIHIEALEFALNTIVGKEPSTDDVTTTDA